MLRSESRASSLLSLVINLRDMMTIKLWILPFATAWIWSLIIHNHVVMATVNDTDAHLKPTVQTKASLEGELKTDSVRQIPFFIIGQDNRCLEANRNVPRLANCNKNSLQQRWDLYEDGSIRPRQDDTMCLVSNDLVEGSNILVLPCSTESSDYQIWQFADSGETIVNPRVHELVIDVASINDLRKLIVWHSNGGDNQKWHLKPIYLL